MEQQPKIPTLKDAQKPQVKIKGMGAGLTLFDRLKQFKKKDLAFILAGLGTLFMAPLAEHFMMAPENGDMTAGFRGAGGGSGSGGGIWGTGSSPYENGGSNIAQGGAIGGAGDIITPLNVRDPSALVMGPGAAQQPPAGSVAAVTPPPTAPSTNSDELKDALAHSAARAGSAALKKAPLPVPKISVGGSALRGLGAASGGNSSGSGSLGPINSGNLGQAGTGGGGLNLVRSTPGFKGAAGPRGPNSPSGLDGTKKAGANAGDAFSRTGSALSGLNAAASEQIPTGGQGFGGGGQGGVGANDKPGGGAGAAGSKSVGESLAFIEAKERMMENLKLEFEKKKLKDPELLLYGIRNDMAKGFGTELGKVLTKAALAPLSADFWAKSDGSTPGYQCGNTWFAKTDPVQCVTDGSPLYMGRKNGDKCEAASGQPLTVCVPYAKPGKADPATGATERGSATGSSGMNYGGALQQSAPVIGAGLDGGCDGLDKLLTTEKVEGNGVATVVKGESAWYTEMKPRGAQLVNARAMLDGGGSSRACGNSPLAGETASQLQSKALQYLNAELPAMNGLVGKGKDGEAALAASLKNIEIAKGAVTTAGSQITEAGKLITGAGDFAAFKDNATPLGTDSTKKLTDAKAELGKVQDTMAKTQANLELALKKAQATVGGGEDAKVKPTLAEVLGQNESFIAMTKAIEARSKDALWTSKEGGNWSSAKVEPAKDASAGTATADPDSARKAAVGEADSAQASIKAVCEKIKGCDGPPPAAMDPKDIPAVADVPLAPATKSVSDMRQIQSNAINGLSIDLKALGAK